MSYRQLFILIPCHLSIKNDSISIQQYRHENLVPVNDVFTIIIDSEEVTFTSNFFTRCSKEHITILICNEKHYPNCIVNSLNQHYRPYQILKYQLSFPESSQELITEQLLKNKIDNQYKVIQLINNDENILKLLKKYSEEITGKDQINREGIAAKIFFKSLYGEDFVRMENDNINFALNYGYAVLRSVICRTVNSYGLLAYLGVNHHGNENPFNLVYDLIEPFRPIIDYYVAKHITDIYSGMGVEEKKEIVNLLNANVKVNNKSVKLQYAIELLVKSYLNCIENGESNLEYIELTNINFSALNDYI
ncbi:MAG: type II CRISPR-associated endonuclease Cas1 [Bacilli bacterium]|jgi:CRISPR-associated protein Cas1|nr:type II CRISPR-associated endonuclease Cas1 [Bacilli bacterium]